MLSAKTEHIHFRISKYEKDKLERFKVNIPVICRRAIERKIRDLVNDPDLLISEGDESPAAPFVQAWQRILPVITLQLTPGDYLHLKSSTSRLEDLKVIATSPQMKAEELENFGKFLQGEDISERILMACVEANL
jgi:N-dimethylarginine dimethylaminohydrolase